MKSDITLIAISNIYILRNIINCPKISQRCFGVKKVSNPFLILE